MVRRKAKEGSLFLLLSVFAVPVFCQVPGVTHYQGSLRDKSGNPINASLPMVISIYDTPTPGTGTQLWTENQTVGISNGVFSIAVGAVNPIPASVFSSSSTYLEVDINGETPSARPQLLSNPYSFHSSVADTADYALTVSSSIAVSTINATASTPFGGVNITTSAFIQGNVGIGTGVATSTLTVNGPILDQGDFVVHGITQPTGTCSIGSAGSCNATASCPAGTTIIATQCIQNSGAGGNLQNQYNGGCAYNCTSACSATAMATCARLQ